MSPNSGSEGTLLSVGRPEQTAGLSDPKPWVLVFSRPWCVHPMPTGLPTQPYWLGLPLPATHGAPLWDCAGSGALQEDCSQNLQAWASRESQGQSLEDREGLKTGPSLQAVSWTEFQGQAGA